MTEAEQVLCRESVQIAQQATKAQEAMDQHYKAKWQQAEADLKALCQANSAQVQPFATKVHETNAEHQQLHTAQERQLQLEKLLWKRQLSQESTYRAEIHELHTELLNMKEKSEMKSHLAANMCKIEQTVPSRTVDSEPENVLNTLSLSRQKHSMDFSSGSNGSGGGGAPPPPGGQPGGSTPPGNTPPQQTGGAGPPGGAPQSPPGIPQPNRQPDPWASLDRSRKPLPKLMLPSNYKACSILDMRQILESWYDKSAFAVATWRGDADALPKSIADACMRHGYCTAELIVWYVLKQLILPHDINEVTMQKEILTHPKVAPSTLDRGCAWLEEMQHRLNLCMKTGQQVHPRTVITFVQEVLSGSHSTIVQWAISGTAFTSSISCENLVSLWKESMLCLRSS